MDNADKVSRIMDDLKPELKKLALDIHNNPELGGEEKKACRWQTELLTKYGFEVTPDFCSMATAYKAVYKGKKSGPNIAFLSEYDALPEIGHGCGHNLIAMLSVGAGIGLKDFADEYGGNIYVIGTPAEETKGSKVEMAEKGAFNDLDVVMMAHPSYTNGDSLNTMAMKSYRIEFFGKAAHAAAAPEEGINALDSMISFFNMIGALRQQTQDDARIHGIITKGGVSANVIPDHTEAIVYVRANKCAYLEKLAGKVIDCAKGAALGTGAELKVTKYEESFKDADTNQTLAALCTSYAEKLGAEVTRFDGLTVSASSDLGDVSHICPAIQTTFKIGDAPDGNLFSLHTEHFAECAASDEGIDNALLYAKAFVLAGIDIMRVPGILEEIKAEFGG